MNAISLFSGIGGFDLGLERAGFRVVAQIENDPFCQRVLAARWPHVARWPDVREWQSERHESADRLEQWTLTFAPATGQQFPQRVDCLVGGFPCQDLSVAGKRAGLGGSRSSLFWEYVRIAKALTPTYGLVENVPGLLSSQRGADFLTVLEGLRDCWPVVGWRIVDSQYFGVPQRRRRVFLVGGPTAASVAEILALTEGGDGDSAASGQAGARPTCGLESGIEQSGRIYDARGVVPMMRHGTGGRTGPMVADFAGPLGGGNDGIGRRTEDDPNLVVASTVRRLTPLECERLQGFLDGFTCLCQPLSAYAADPDEAALACRCPDSPRYRALGNAVTVPVIEWLGRRFATALQ